MNILFVTNMYPIAQMRHFGIFVKEQVDHLTNEFAVQPKLYFINARDDGKMEYLKSILRIRRLIKQQKIDAVHIHYGISGLFLFFFRPSIRVFLTLHGGDILRNQGFFIQNMLSRWIIKRVDKVFVLNEEMRREVARLGARYEILPCGVNAQFFNKQEFDAPKDHILIVFPGDPKLTVKNFSLFRQTVEILKRRFDREVTHACIHNLDRRQVRDLLVKADCLIMTSISEGSPQVVKEALACNLPVVSVDVGDVKEMLKDLPSCAIAGDRTPEALADLATSSIKFRSEDIRSLFLAKNIYDNHSVCKRLMANYTSAMV